MPSNLQRMIFFVGGFQCGYRLQGRIKFLVAYNRIETPQRTLNYTGKEINES